MTNTENLTTTPDDLDYVHSDVDDIDFDGPGFTETEATGSLANPGVTLYRYFLWARKTGRRGSRVNLEAYSPERQAGIAYLVDHGLLSERVYASGTRSFRVTELGELRLAEIRATADAALVVA